MIDVKEHVAEDYMRCIYCRGESTKIYDVIFYQSNVSNTTLCLCENCLLELKNKIEIMLKLDKDEIFKISKSGSVHVQQLKEEL